jgi:hypothetical protein
MASRHLVLFATSDAPDPYVNSIAHAVAHLGVSSVEIIVISEHDYPAELSGSAWATRVSERVTAQIEALATQMYIEYQADKSGGTRQPLAGAETAGVYGTVLSVINKGGMAARIVPLGGLYSELGKFVHASRSCVFDVTALKKNLLIDVAVALLALDHDEVFAFELKKPPSFDQSDLIHRLSSPADYAYRNLLDSGPVATGVSRLRRLAIRSKALAVLATVLLIVSLALFVWQPDSRLLALIGVVSGIASIASALYPFVVRLRE